MNVKTERQTRINYLKIFSWKSIFSVCVETSKIIEKWQLNLNFTKKFAMRTIHQKTGKPLFSILYKTLPGDFAREKMYLAELCLFGKQFQKTEIFSLERFNKTEFSEGREMMRKSTKQAGGLTNDVMD